MSSPFNCARFSASQVHYLISSDPEVRSAAILDALRSNHGVKHVSQMDLNHEIYKEWKRTNAETDRALKAFETSLEASREAGVVIPEGVDRCLFMEVGNAEEIHALGLFEKQLAEKLGTTDYVVTSDQARREMNVGDNIVLIGKFDAKIERAGKDGKRITKGIVEVKTRMRDFRENPADLTQLTIYSRMMPNPSKVSYTLLEYLPLTKEIKTTPFPYATLQEHWENVVYPGLVRVYPEVCAVWQSRMDEDSVAYIGRVYFTRITTLIDKILQILRVPDLNGDSVLISLLDSSKEAVASNVKASYDALCKSVNAKVLLKVKNRDLEFFRHNIQAIVHISEANKGYRDHIDKYSEYLVGIMRENVSEKTRNTIWTMVDQVLATV